MITIDRLANEKILSECTRGMKIRLTTTCLYDEGCQKPDSPARQTEEVLYEEHNEHRLWVTNTRGNSESMSLDYVEKVEKV